MSNLLKKVKEKLNEKPKGLIVCIAGDNGMGKTPISCIGWRHPILVIQSEDGIKHKSLVEKVGKTIFPTGVLSKSDDLIDYLMELKGDESNEFKTVVIDTITGFSRHFEMECVNTSKEINGIKDPVQLREKLKKLTIATSDDGYYRAATYVTKFNTDVANLINEIAKKGVTFILIFQSKKLETETDDGQKYDVTSFNLISSAKEQQLASAAEYTSIADAVYYIAPELRVLSVGSKGNEYEKVTAKNSDGKYTRYLIGNGDPLYKNSKNRINPEYSKLEYNVGENPLIPWVKEYFNSFKQNKEVNENGVN